jgi:hypothetical protein
MTRFPMMSATLLTACLLLAACGTGPVRRVSEPAVDVQQLTVRADGSWSVDLRINNFSNVPMRFDRIDLAMTLGEQPAGTLQGQPGLSIGPQSADVATLALVPSPAAKIAVADALVRNGSVAYTLKGTVDAAAEDSRVRSYDIQRNNSLSAVPGIAGTLR